MVIDTNSINPAQPGKRNGGADSAALDKKAVGNNSDLPESSTPRSVDTVELSTQAQNLGRLQDELRNLPEVDEARVAQIRQQIANGDYRIDVDQIAGNILRDDQSF